MKELLIFAGTTEGRELSEYLSAAGIVHTVCVATEYGATVLKECENVRILTGRMEREEMTQLLRTKRYVAVVDATHPYAELATENIRFAADICQIPYLRLIRDDGGNLCEKKCEEECFEQRNEAWELSEEKLFYFENSKMCAKALVETKGNILLTTGSKELSVYCSERGVKERLYVRVLPGMESLSLCMEQKLLGKQIIAMQGPFSEELNEALIRQLGIAILVTKQSGETGGYYEKIKAARKTGTTVFIIGRPKETNGLSFEKLLKRLEKLLAVSLPSIQNKTELTTEIILAGAGMGSRESMTVEVLEAIETADVLFGANRIVKSFQPEMRTFPYYRAEQIIPQIKMLQKTGNIRKAVILFSGDSGFYSGCQGLYRALREAVQSKTLNAEVRILPGISSVAYLAAKTGVGYQDGNILSIHGKELCNLIAKIKTERNTWLLTSGVSDVQKLGRLLLEADMEKCRITTGYQLSYKEENIRTMTPLSCAKLTDEGLYTCLIQNPQATPKHLTHGLSDEAFLRGSVPMTKEEIREVSICKLRLYPGAVVYDIGGGTGSISVEIARLSDEIRVYSVEYKEDAVSLMEENRKKFGLENIKIIKGNAPEVFKSEEKLPPATHAFIGGSGGRLKEILRTLYEINPAMRVVINAISIETIIAIQEIRSLFPIQKEEIVQMQISRAKQTGAFRLMRAENPIWICTFEFGEEKNCHENPRDVGRTI